MGKHVLILELEEEWRMLTSYFSSRTLFFAFPLVLLLVGFSMALLTPLVKEAFDMRELTIALHLFTCMYGMFVGGFGFFAEEVATRWFREAKLLIHMHAILPVSFRRIFVFFYIKDILYYLLLTIYPLLIGALLSFTIPPAGFLRMVLSFTFSFLIGISLSFFLSSLYVRSRLLCACALILLLFSFSLLSFEDFFPTAYFFKGEPIYLLYSLVTFLLFSAASLAMAEPVERATKEQFRKSGLFSAIDPLLAKEILDVWRSGTFKIVLTSYLFPLLFLSGMLYFTERLLNFHLDISLVFYAGFVGYLGTLVYSWLNNIDPPSSMVTLPITDSDIIKRKIKLFMGTSLSLSFVYLLFLAFLTDGIPLLPLSCLTMGATTFYVASVTAYLCGLYPNTLLFEGTILARYLASILPVLISLSLLSFMKAYTAIFFISFIVLLLSTLIYRRLDGKYERMNL